MSLNLRKDLFISFFIGLAHLCCWCLEKKSLFLTLKCLPLKDAVSCHETGGINGLHVKSLSLIIKFSSCLHAIDKLRQSLTMSYISLHKGPILKFRLGGFHLTTCPDIDHWLLFLSKKNVQQFTIRGTGSSDKYHLPSHLFTFKHLSHLNVDSCSFHPPPRFKGFPKLINLDLHFVTFDPAILNNLISRCPLLERLTLTCCTGL